MLFCRLNPFIAIHQHNFLFASGEIYDPNTYFCIDVEFTCPCCTHLSKCLPRWAHFLGILLSNASLFVMDSSRIFPYVGTVLGRITLKNSLKFKVEFCSNTIWYSDNYCYNKHVGGPLIFFFLICLYKSYLIKRHSDITTLNVSSHKWRYKWSTRGYKLWLTD